MVSQFQLVWTSSLTSIFVNVIVTVQVQTMNICFVCFRKTFKALQNPESFLVPSLPVTLSTDVLRKHFNQIYFLIFFNLYIDNSLSLQGFHNRWTKCGLAQDNEKKVQKHTPRLEDLFEVPYAWHLVGNKPLQSNQTEVSLTLMEVVHTNVPSRCFSLPTGSSIRLSIQRFPVLFSPGF